MRPLRWLRFGFRRGRRCRFGFDIGCGSTLAASYNPGVIVEGLDGVGDMVWSDNVAVEETLTGFFQGLALKLPISRFSDPLEDCFMGYISSWTEKELYDLSEEIVSLYHPRSPDVPVIKENLKEHVERLYKAINN